MKEHTLPFLIGCSGLAKVLPRLYILVAATFSSSLLSKVSAVPWTTLDISLACMESSSMAGIGVIVVSSGADKYVQKGIMCVD